MKRAWVLSVLVHGALLVLLVWLGRQGAEVLSRTPLLVTTIEMAPVKPRVSTPAAPPTESRPSRGPAGETKPPGGARGLSRKKRTHARFAMGNGDAAGATQGDGNGTGTGDGNGSGEGSGLGGGIIEPVAAP